MEELLSKEEIEAILKESKHPRYSAPNTIFFTLKKTHIFSYSSESGLIIIQGNEDTGLEHIQLRHSKTSNKPYWKEGNKLENQSRLMLGLAPFQYISVASEIYKPENRSDEKNRRPELFDVYIGEYTHKNNLSVEYTLITYKNTGIIHTFFVSDNKKPFNKKKILDLRRGWSYGTSYPTQQKQVLKTPYYDPNNFEIVSVIINYSEITNIEEWIIKLNSTETNPEVKIKVAEKERIVHPIFGNDAGTRIIQLNYIDDPSWIEKHIKQILKEYT